MTILLDTGPLLASLDTTDDHHVVCTELLSGLRGHMAVPAPVLVEVCYFLQTRGGSKVEGRFLDSLAAGELDLVPTVSADLTRMAELVRIYGDLPLGAVDASVIAVAERLGIREVATLDRRHFGVVRPRHVEALTLLPE